MVVQSGGKRFFALTVSHGAFLPAVAVFLLFIAALDCQFVALDDYAYVVDNHHIANLDWNTVRWAFTSFHEGNWHPLTLLSLAVDRYFWQFDPLGYHLTNILLHCLTVLITCHLFSMLLGAALSLSPDAGRRQRGIVIGSLAGAIFFGLHPLRVESVVWISERKDVLCLVFMTSAMWCYLRYVHQSAACGRGGSCWRFRSYWAALALSGLALMSKAVAVSMPLILVIIDWYPLGRRSGRGSYFLAQIDKIPFVLFSLAGSVLAIHSQRGATKVFDELDLFSRLLVACKALFFYLAKTLWPSDLGPFYLHPGSVAATARGEHLLYVLLTVAMVLAVAWTGRRWRMWPALFGYYVVTLAPMLGVIQVGGQWVADRYSYLPALGLSLAWGGGVTWLVNHLDSEKTARSASIGLVLAACQLLAYGALTWRQIPVWSTTETLTSRIIDLQPHRTGEVYYVRAVYRNHIGQYDLALADIGEAMRGALQQNRREAIAKIAFVEARILKNLGRISEALAMAELGAQVSLGAPSAEEIALRDELQRLKRAQHQPERGGASQ